MNLQIYKNPEIGSVRAVTVDGVPYFIGKDVASILGYERPAKAILDHVDVEIRMKSQFRTPLVECKILLSLMSLDFIALFYQVRCQMRKNLNAG